MTPATADAAAPALARDERDERKRRLLLASGLARGELVGTFDELAGQADSLAARFMALRAWLSNPLVWGVGGTVGMLLLTVVMRRDRALHLLSWGLQAWGAWRSVAAALARYRARQENERTDAPRAP